MEREAIRRALTTNDRALVKKLVDDEVRRRHQVADEETAALMRRHLARKA